MPISKRYELLGWVTRAKNRDIIEDEYYEEDGIHFKANFYPIWAEKMAEVATL